MVGKIGNIRVVLAQHHILLVCPKPPEICMEETESKMSHFFTVQREKKKILTKDYLKASLETSGFGWVLIRDCPSGSVVDGSQQTKCTVLSCLWFDTWTLWPPRCVQSHYAQLSSPLPKIKKKKKKKTRVGRISLAAIKAGPSHKHNQAIKITPKSPHPWSSLKCCLIWEQDLSLSLIWTSVL